MRRLQQNLRRPGKKSPRHWRSLVLQNGWSSAVPTAPNLPKRRPQRTLLAARRMPVSEKKPLHTPTRSAGPYHSGQHSTPSKRTPSRVKTFPPSAPRSSGTTPVRIRRIYIDFTEDTLGDKYLALQRLRADLRQHAKQDSGAPPVSVSYGPDGTPIGIIPYM